MESEGTPASESHAISNWVNVLLVKAYLVEKGYLAEVWLERCQRLAV